MPHIRPRGEEKKELERSPDFHARCWVVEVTHSFFNRFRKLLVRYEKKAANYLALLRLFAGRLLEANIKKGLSPGTDCTR